ncbi:MAG: hypothetical protein U9R25_07605 [Chloroflexota bacterium]|nr:hypothetical protein [Chloroflexota bacterium]
MNERLKRRRTLLLQLALAVLALVSLLVTLWAVANYVQQWSFSLPTKTVLEMVDPQQETRWQDTLTIAINGVEAIVAPSTLDRSDLIAIILPLITTVVSVLALLSTTWLAWRRERREARKDAFEIEQLRLEIESLRRSLQETDSR